MSLLRLTFLGTSAAQPTIHRNLSGLAVKADTDLLLFDCGEGSQRQMIRYGTGFPVEIVELRGGDSVKRGSYQVRAVQVEHRVNALAYVLEEGARAGKFNLER